jgi:hypothetical protein
MGQIAAQCCAGNCRDLLATLRDYDTADTSWINLEYIQPERCRMLSAPFSLRPEQNTNSPLGWAVFCSLTVGVHSRTRVHKKGRLFDPMRDNGAHERREYSKDKEEID